MAPIAGVEEGTSSKRRGGAWPPRQAVESLDLCARRSATSGA